MGARGLRKRQEPLIVVQGQLDTNEHATNDHIHKKAHHHHKDMEAAVVKDHEIGDNKVVVEDHPHATLKNKVHEKHHKQDMADDELVSPEHQDDKVDPDTHDLEEEQDQKVEKKKKKKEEKAEDKEIAKDEPRDEVLIGDNVSDNEIMDDIEPLVVEKVGKHKHGHGHKVNDEQEVRNNKNHHTKELDQDDQTEVDRIQDVLQDIFNRNNNNNNNDDHAPELEQQNGEQIVEVQRKKKKKPMHKEEAQDQRQLGLGNDDRHIKKASRNRQASQPVQADAVPNAPPTAATPVVPQTPPGPPQAPQNNQNQNPSTQPQGPQQGVVPQTPPPSGGQPERAKPGSQPGSETKAGAPGAPGGYGTVPMFGPAQLDLGSGASSLANIGSSLSLAVALVVVMMTAM
ncbi:hypothetical protein B0O80DRAFT_443941 [Mortierella sp. GBAus27b]|nr:hypothetical protein B0O80DRAFT_443941 [Mortierella sp. GBAus27b]